MALLDSESHAFSTNFTDYVTYGVYQFSEWIWNNSIGTATSTPPGPLGDNYVVIQASNQTKRAMNTSSNTFFMGCRLNALSYGGNIIIIYADNTDLIQFSIYLNSIGGASIYLGVNGASATNADPTTGTLIGTINAGTFPTASWFYLEIGATVAASNGGSIIIKRNGSDVVFSASGITTQGQATDALGLVTFKGTNNSTFNMAHYYLCDNTGPVCNTFLGDVRIQGIFPTLNASVQFSPIGNSNNWQNAAVVPPNPTVDYNSSSLTGAQDTFHFSTITHATTIYGINSKVLAETATVGTRQIQNVVVSGSTTSLGISTALSTVPNVTSTIYETDPNTSTLWTVGGIASLTAGYKISV